MKRDYTDGVADDVVFFIGNEVEHTPAFGLRTLFVTGVQPVDAIARNLQGCEHIFFGANHSYNPQNNQHNNRRVHDANSLVRTVAEKPTDTGTVETQSGFSSR